MATDQAPGQRGEAVPVGGPAEVLSPAIVASYESMIASVPDAGSGGYEQILADLAAATDVEDLDAPWQSNKLERFANVELQVGAIAKMPSEFEGGLPFFLILDAAIVASGEKVSIATGAVSVVAQLVKAHQLGSLPLRVIPRVAKRPSARGYYPMHLELVRR